MEKPYKYYAYNETTGEQVGFNHMWLRPYEFIGKPYPWVIYEYTRYKAAIRLYNYINGIKPVKYNPYAETEIGKSTPILNF